jgi:hypothetical protein
MSIKQVSIFWDPEIWTRDLRGRREPPLQLDQDRVIEAVLFEN